MQKESEGVQALRQLLEAGNTDVKTAEALVASRKARENQDKKAELRSWIAIGISFCALIVSIFAIIFSQRK